MYCYPIDLAKSNEPPMNTDRRVFLIQSSLGLACLGASSLAFAMAGPVTDEKDPKAVALGYRDDAGKVDTAKFPAYAAGQNCGGCSNFKGSPGIAAGPCPRMPKPVLASGWCSAYAKKS
jgi:hypothetical protein